ncbi:MULTISPECIES: HAD-IIB family hydrolase [unclassified Acidisoma]|uniref:HAD-IIB family hydrolase n=1 Tax=unclassified Acidisoma TaxID=2634065 RepID=UPI00131B506A|nr:MULTISPECIES: HAD-IIB family hydrolase [unclassified Acidisoma]
MFVLHIALQGCLRATDIEYGVNVDTGGHIRYLLGLVEASQKSADIDRIVVATRAFDSEFGPDYAAPSDRMSDKVEIVRFRTVDPGYLPKEDLWREVPSYAEALIDWIEQQPVRPAIIHAHYADAGVVADIVRGKLGIPYVFVAHSLGRVKRKAFLDSGGVAHPDSESATDIRIKTEERAVAGASLIIASSRDEAENQYADYEAYRPGHIRIIPPGAELTTFRTAMPNLSVDKMINRFLVNHDKPPLLTLARPVVKKNIAALLHAFGESKALQEKANLVIFVGNRDDLNDLEPESAGILKDILYLIDLYDLYGKVALPKSHQPADVPAIYAYAWYRRGIFVNPALNEPFGLTLLEAAAVGLPIIATDSGGPNDIVEICQNGELVDPNDPGEIAASALRILNDEALWQDYSSEGFRAVRRFDWRSHANRYHRLLGAVIKQEGQQQPAPRELLVCDIDNTLLGSRPALAEFSEWFGTQHKLGFAIASGRSLHSALSVLEQEEAPLPDIMITSVGSEIYYRQPDHPSYVPDLEWADWISENWEREQIIDALQDIPGLRPQSPLEQRRFKLSYIAHGKGDFKARVEEALQAHNLSASVAFSHNRYLDVLPRRASKGTAVEFVGKRLGLANARIFVAGDSGNDIEMLRTMPNSIIVANFRDGLGSHEALSHCFIAPRRHARGVVDGVTHFRTNSAASARLAAASDDQEAMAGSL